MDAASFVASPLPLKRAHNVRDLGGYPRMGAAGRTRAGAYLRGDSLHRLKRGDIECLRGYGLTRVIDLRSPFELRLWPSPFAKRALGVEYVSIPMMDQLNSSGFKGNLPTCMFDVYRSILDDDADDIRRVFEALDCSGCVAFHCRAGKDRTGVIAMLLLDLAGVPESEIIEDYAATGRYMYRSLLWQRRLVSVFLRRRIPRCMLEAKPEDMARTLAYLRERYGDARTYLVQAAGCAPAVVERVRARLCG